MRFKKANFLQQCVKMLANPTGLPVLLPFLAKNLHFLNSATLSLAEFLLFTLCSVQTGCRLSNAKSGKNGNSASIRAHEFDSPLPKGNRGGNDE